MTDILDYALMAGAAYQSTRDDKNKMPWPDQWQKLPDTSGNRQFWHRQNDASGFEAVAFANGNNIVISYAGTYPKQTQDVLADAQLGAGTIHSQLFDAAKYYEDIRQAYPFANISFTGHSLGGGLAALMGVFFNKTAVTFDPAPFRKAATISNAMYLNRFLGDLDLARFYATGGLQGLGAIIRGENKVSAVAVSGEFLSVTLFDALRIRSGSTAFLHHGNEDMGGVAGMAGFGKDVLHAQTLLIALKQSESFRQASYQLPYLIPDDIMKGGEGDDWIMGASNDAHWKQSA